jgi:hypothetical protein
MYKFIWIQGRFGGGKTSLSLHLADQLVSGGHVRYAAVNFPLNVSVPYRTTDSLDEVYELRDVVILLDEAGMVFDLGASPKMVKNFLRNLRKRNQIVLMASVLPVHKFAQQFNVQRMFNGLQMGFPFWWYRWNLGFGQTKDKGNYVWWFPARIFGLYDTEFEPDDTWYIYDFGVDDDRENDSSGGLEDGDRQIEFDVGIDDGVITHGDRDCPCCGARIGGDVVLESRRQQ